MLYDHILEFRGEWRSYQKRVLDHFLEYKRDGKVHIVAAPGSGKTTLGIELKMCIRDRQDSIALDYGLQEQVLLEYLSLV